MSESIINFKKRLRKYQEIRLNWKQFAQKNTAVKDNFNPLDISGEA